jgi:nucleoside-diphosphate-sugar epimerase
LAFVQHDQVFSFVGLLAIAFSAAAMKVLVTGASGFVGGALCADLSRRSNYVLGAVRTSPAPMPGVEWVNVGELGAFTDWEKAVLGVDAVIHLAARVHVMDDKAVDPLAEFRKVNVDGTLNLARQAAAAGVKRFVFMSSVKVNGESTQAGHPFLDVDAPAPQDAYGQSKHEAEQGLREVASKTGMEVVIIRPPLVYGPGVKANFAALVRAVQKGWPLPLGAVHNQRSLVALDNLVDFVVTCSSHPLAANQTFMVSDGHDFSTTELVCGLADALKVPKRLLPVPVWMLEAGATLLGKREAVLRLCGNLQIDISKARSLLGWIPPVSADEGLRRAVSTMVNR